MKDTDHPDHSAERPDHPSGLTLTQRARKGVFWVGVVTLGSKLLTVLTTILLARILVPSDFGLMAVAGVVVSALAIFTDLGMGAAIIHSRRDRQQMASTAFFIVPGVGIILYTIAFLTAHPLAVILGSPDATNIIRLVSLNILFASFGLVPSVLMEKDMAYRRKVVPDLLPTIVYVIVALTLAREYHLGAYSMALALVAQGFLGLILNWLFAGWVPSLVFYPSIARELLAYSKNVLGGTIILYLTTNMDNAFVNRTSGSSALGVYTLAYNVANLPATHVADVFGRVLFPSFVELNRDSARLRQAYIRALTIVVVVTFPLLTGIAAMSDPFVHVVLGPKWLAMIIPLQVLTIFAALRVVAGPTGSLFLAVGRSTYILYNGVVGISLQAVCLTVALVVWHLGVPGAAWAVSIASVLNAFFVGYWLHKVVPFNVLPVVPRALRLVSPSLVMGAVVYWLARQLPYSFWSLLTEIAAGAAVYLATHFLFNGSALLRDIAKLALKREKAGGAG
jgi:O-antigen/teichoic acid export membrane protein